MPPVPSIPTQIGANTVLATPSKPHDFHLQIEYLQHNEKLSRDVRTVLTKARKALSGSFMREAKQMVTIQAQNSKIETLEEKKTKKRIYLDPNQQFASIEDIIKARDAASSTPATTTAKTRRKRIKTGSSDSRIPDMESYMTVWNFHEN